MGHQFNVPFSVDRPILPIIVIDLEGRTVWMILGYTLNRALRKPGPTVVLLFVNAAWQ